MLQARLEALPEATLNKVADLEGQVRTVFELKSASFFAAKLLESSALQCHAVLQEWIRYTDIPSNLTRPLRLSQILCLLDLTSFAHCYLLSQGP